MGGSGISVTGAQVKAICCCCLKWMAASDGILVPGVSITMLLSWAAVAVGVCLLEGPRIPELLQQLRDGLDDQVA